MKRLLCAAPLLFVAVACNEPFSNEDILFLKAIPTKEQVELRIPEGLSTCTTPTTAVYYAFGQEITLGLNDGVQTVLNIVSTVVRTPATQREDDLRIWGPWADGDVEYQFAMNRVITSTIVKVTSTSTATALDVVFQYALQARRLGQPEFITAFGGTFAPTETLDSGMGAIFFNFEGIHQNINPNSEERGLILLAYDNRFGQSTIQGVIDAEVMEGTPFAKPEGFFAFSETAEGAKRFDFLVEHNVEGTPEPPREYLYVRQRYTADERGRADVAVTGGDLGAAVYYVSECWDECLLRTYLDGNVPDQQKFGDLTACAPELQVDPVR